MSKKVWDLTPLYKSYKQVDKDIERLVIKVEAFNENYKNRIHSLHSEVFKYAVGEYESIMQQLSRIMSYVYLEFATDDSKGAILNKYQTKTTVIQENLLFFELEFGDLDTLSQDIYINKIEKYSFFLESIKKEKKYQLSLKEEQILLKKDLTSNSAWSRLFDEYISKIEFVYDKKRKSEEEILALLYNENREVRKKASLSLTQGLKSSSHILAYIFNMIKSDLKISTELRGYESPETPRHLSNKISQQSVDNLIETTMKNSNLVSRYYTAKAKILKIKNLKDYDRYAPITKSTKKIPYKKAKKLVLGAFKNFDKQMYDIAKMAFDEGWIDVYPKATKRGGAFSHPTIPDAHPYILLNYTEGVRDVFTLAHELGHAIHQYLSYKVGYINSDTPLTTSETASIFAEMLLFDYLKDKFNKKELQSIYSSKLEDIYATLYRQIIFTTFERRVHSYDGELSVEKFSQFWREENSKMFGNSVELTSNYDIWWSYIPHFIHSPFYCYSYSYGQLLVLTLYTLYKDKQPNFVENYKKFLSSGGSQSPKELLSIFDIDIDSSEFWELGIKQIKVLLKEFEHGLR